MTVYFVQSGPYVKIGYSSNPIARIGTLQGGNPEPLTTLFFMAGNMETERELHTAFSDYHHSGEWFRHEGELLEFIEFNGRIFAEYTTRIIDGYIDSGEDTIDYWRTRALKAEKSRVEPVIRASGNGQRLYSTWKHVPRDVRTKIALLTRDEIQTSYGPMSLSSLDNWFKWSKEFKETV